MRERVGIFAGSFDPVHKGHIAFALQALKEANLSTVYFLPEPKPRRKTGVTHISHRVAMLERALRPHSALKTLELPDKEFSVTKTMPRLKQKLPDTELFLLIGADSELEHLPNWPLAGQLLKNFGLIIAERSQDKEKIKTTIKSLPKPPRALYILKTSGPNISS